MNFDDFMFAVKDVADMAGKKTEEVVGVSKLKLEKCRIEREIRDLYRKIGEATYQSLTNNNSNEEYVKSLCDTVKDRTDYLDELEQMIAQKKDMVVCKTCKSQNDKENIYCKQCGNKL